MFVHPDCLPCFVRQIHSLCQLVGGTDEERLAWAREATRAVLDADWSVAPPVLTGLLHERVCRLAGVEDPYAEAKRRQNESILARLPGLRARVAAEANPLAAALRLSMAGNVIDLGIRPELREEEIDAAVEQAFALQLPAASLERFAREVATARRILFLADNAGEIVFDRLLLERLPREKIVLAVRGRPILNDVTLHDVGQVGLPDLVPVVENGAGVPGTALPLCSPGFRAAFDSADLVISKGQGNFETLWGTPKPIWFLFKAKCAVVRDALGVPVGTLVFRRQEAGPAVG